MASNVGDVHTFLGKGAEFTGKLSFDGSVRIDGKFNGEIQTQGTLIIGEGARTEAEVNAGTVIIQGALSGGVKASQAVELTRTANARIRVETPALSMEKGCFFEGSCKMGPGGPSTVAQQDVTVVVPSPVPEPAVVAQSVGGKGDNKDAKRK
jgi:cytoskeletal protein CcmA (bactofilin family)